MDAIAIDVAAGVCRLLSLALYIVAAAARCAGSGLRINSRVCDAGRAGTHNMPRRLARLASAANREQQQSHNDPHGVELTTACAISRKGAA
jgi:hypothetical protein